LNGYRTTRGRGGQEVRHGLSIAGRCYRRTTLEQAVGSVAERRVGRADGASPAGLVAERRTGRRASSIAPRGDERYDR
jgi:hypothetical protein